MEGGGERERKKDRLLSWTNGRGIHRHEVINGRKTEHSD